MADKGSFYLPTANWSLPYVLDGAEARHLLRSVRAAPGDTLRLFDGQGREGRFVLKEARKREALLEPLDIIEASPRSGGMTLALGWNKAGRRSMLFEKCVELEAAGLWFWQAEHSQGKVPSEPKETWTERLISGAKQCDNPWLPEMLTFPQGLESMLEQVDAFDRIVALLEPSIGEEATLFAPPEDGERVLVVLGPEGGFSELETELLREKDIAAASLGTRVLRWETAALLCLGLGYFERQKQS